MLSLSQFKPIIDKRDKRVSENFWKMFVFFLEDERKQVREGIKQAVYREAKKKVNNVSFHLDEDGEDHKKDLINF